MVVEGGSGEPSKDGVSATHSWNGTVLTITSASGTSSADLKGDTGATGEPGPAGPAGADGQPGEKGEPGQPGKDGTSATHRWNGTVLTVTSASGTSSANLKGDKGDPGEKGDKGDTGEKGDKGDPGEKGDKGDPGEKGDKGDTGATGAAGPAGADGAKGDKGDTGENGKDGVSATHSWNGTVLTITSASGTSSADLKGDKGDTGATGPAGAAGKDGKDYVLTATDKAEIAEQVENATIVQAPKYVNTVEEMTDPNRPYVLISTGRIWANAQTTVEKEVTVTDNIVATSDNPYKDGNRLGSSGDAFNADATGYHVTPLIDLTKYAGKTIQLHLEGAQYSSTGAYAQWIQCRFYGNDKTVLTTRPYTVDTNVTGSYHAEVSGMVTTYNSSTSTTVTITVPPTFSRAKTPVGYLRFCGKGAVADSKISITYQDMQTTTGVQWFDTGTTYAPTLTDADRQAMVDEVVEMVDIQLLNIIGDGAVTV